jgi:hypothetical protein
VGAWALPASVQGLPYVIRAPIPDLNSLERDRDPAWIHVPGAWWGVAQAAVQGAVLAGQKPELLAEGLARNLGLAPAVSTEGTGGSSGEDEDHREPVEGAGQ